MKVIREYLQRRRWMKDPALRSDLEYLERLVAGEATTFVVEDKDLPGKQAVHRKGGGHLIFSTREVAEHWNREALISSKYLILEKRFEDIQFTAHNSVFLLISTIEEGPPTFRLALRWHGKILEKGPLLRKFVDF